MVKMVMEWAWRLRRDFNVTRVEPNIFEFTFMHSLDKYKVLQGAPWLINTSQIILKKWPMNLQLQNVDFNNTKCWVHIHNLPPDQINPQNALMLGMLFGWVPELNE